MRNCLGCLAAVILWTVASYDAWIAAGWVLEEFFDMGGTFIGVCLQIAAAGIAALVMPVLIVMLLLKH